MKKLLGVLMLIAVVFSSSAQESTNYLKLKGKILNEHKASVQVFEYNIDTEQWAEIINKDNRSSYSMRLSTKKNYKIYFQSDKGYSKVMEIISGSPGMWIERIDIDFNRTDSTYLTLEQENKNKPYKFIAQKNCSYTDIAINN
jgi:outer membrane lipoprotein-sorting protein